MDGRHPLIQDTTDTIAHFEEKIPEPALIPKTPVQKAVARLIGFFASEARNSRTLPPTFRIVVQRSWE